MVTGDISFAVEEPRAADSKSDTLAPESRFTSPVVRWDDKNDDFALSEKRGEPYGLEPSMPSFGDMVTFRYVNLLVGGFLKEIERFKAMKVSEKGVGRYFDKFRKSVNVKYAGVPDKFGRFRLAEMSWDGEGIRVPYDEVEGGRSKVEGRGARGEATSSMPPIVVLRYRLVDKPKEPLTDATADCGTLMNAVYPMEIPLDEKYSLILDAEQEKVVPPWEAIVEALGSTRKRIMAYKDHRGTLGYDILRILQDIETLKEHLDRYAGEHKVDINLLYEIVATGDPYGVFEKRGYPDVKGDMLYQMMTTCNIIRRVIDKGEKRISELEREIKAGDVIAEVKDPALLETLSVMARYEIGQVVRGKGESGEYELSYERGRRPYTKIGEWLSSRKTDEGESHLSILYGMFVVAYSDPAEAKLAGIPPFIDYPGDTHQAWDRIMKVTRGLDGRVDEDIRDMITVRMKEAAKAEKAEAPKEQPSASMIGREIAGALSEKTQASDDTALPERSLNEESERIDRIMMEGAGTFEVRLDRIRQYMEKRSAGVHAVRTVWRILRPYREGTLLEASKFMRERGTVRKDILRALREDVFWREYIDLLRSDHGWVDRQALESRVSGRMDQEEFIRLVRDLERSGRISLADGPPGPVIIANYELLAREAIENQGLDVKEVGREIKKKGMRPRDVFIQDVLDRFTIGSLDTFFGRKYLVDTRDLSDAAYVQVKEFMAGKLTSGKRPDEINILTLASAYGVQGYDALAACADAIDETGIRVPVKFVMTDAQWVSIDKAKTGIYSEEEVRAMVEEGVENGETQRRMRKFFEKGPREGTFRILSAEEFNERWGIEIVFEKVDILNGYDIARTARIGEYDLVLDINVHFRPSNDQYGKEHDPTIDWKDAEVRHLDNVARLLADGGIVLEGSVGSVSKDAVIKASKILGEGFAITVPEDNVKDLMGVSKYAMWLYKLKDVPRENILTKFRTIARGLEQHRTLSGAITALILLDWFNEDLKRAIFRELLNDYLFPVKPETDKNAAMKARSGDPEALMEHFTVLSEDAQTAIMDFLERNKDILTDEIAEDGASERVTRRLRDLRATGDMSRQVKAARELGELGPFAKDAIPELAEVLNGRDEALGRAAAEALFGIDPPGYKTIPYLVVNGLALMDPENPVLSSVIHVMREIGRRYPVTIFTYLEILGGKHAALKGIPAPAVTRAKKAIIAVLAAMYTDVPGERSRIERALRIYSENKEDQIAEAAKAALAGLTENRDVPHLIGEDNIADPGPLDITTSAERNKRRLAVITEEIFLLPMTILSFVTVWPLKKFIDSYHDVPEDKKYQLWAGLEITRGLGILGGAALPAYLLYIGQLSFALTNPWWFALSVIGAIAAGNMLGHWFHNEVLVPLLGFQPLAVKRAAKRTAEEKGVKDLEKYARDYGFFGNVELLKRWIRDWAEIMGVSEEDIRRMMRNNDVKHVFSRAMIIPEEMWVYMLPVLKLARETGMRPVFFERSCHMLAEVYDVLAETIGGDGLKKGMTFKISRFKSPQSMNAILPMFSDTEDKFKTSVFSGSINSQLSEQERDHLLTDAEKAGLKGLYEAMPERERRDLDAFLEFGSEIEGGFVKLLAAKVTRGDIVKYLGDWGVDFRYYRYMNTQDTDSAWAEGYGVGTGKVEQAYAYFNIIFQGRMSVTPEYLYNVLREVMMHYWCGRLLSGAERNGFDLKRHLKNIADKNNLIHRYQIQTLYRFFRMMSVSLCDIGSARGNLRHKARPFLNQILRDTVFRRTAEPGMIFVDDQAKTGEVALVSEIVCKAFYPGFKSRYYILGQIDPEVSKASALYGLVDGVLAPWAIRHLEDMPELTDVVYKLDSEAAVLRRVSYRDELSLFKADPGMKDIEELRRKQAELEKHINALAGGDRELERISREMKALPSFRALPGLTFERELVKHSIRVNTGGDNFIDDLLVPHGYFTKTKDLSDHEYVLMAKEKELIGKYMSRLSAVMSAKRDLIEKIADLDAHVKVLDYIAILEMWLGWYDTMSARIKASGEAITAHKRDIDEYLEKGNAEVTLPGELIEKLYETSSQTYGIAKERFDEAKRELPVMLSKSEGIGVTSLSDPKSMENGTGKIGLPEEYFVTPASLQGTYSRDGKGWPGTKDIIVIHEKPELPKKALGVVEAPGGGWTAHPLGVTAELLHDGTYEYSHDFDHIYPPLYFMDFDIVLAGLPVAADLDDQWSNSQWTGLNEGFESNGIKVGDNEVSRCVSWMVKPGPGNPGYLVQLRKMFEADLVYGSGEKIPYDIFVTPLDQIERIKKYGYDHNDYKGHVTLSFGPDGELKRPDNEWYIMVLNTFREELPWLAGFIRKELEDLENRPFMTTNPAISWDTLKTVEDTVAARDLGLKAPKTGEKTPVVHGDIAGVKYTIKWNSLKNREFNGSRGHIHEGVRKFLGDEELVNRTFKNAGLDLEYSEIAAVIIQYHRASERAVFRMSFELTGEAITRRGPPSETMKFELAMKNARTANDRQADAFRKLHGTGLVPEFGEQVDDIYYEEWIYGPTLNKISRNKKLTPEEVRRITAHWLRIIRKLSPDGNYRPLAVDMNPGNIMYRRAEADPDFVVVDIFGREKLSPAHFFREILRFYVTQKSSDIGSVVPNDIGSVLKGVLDGFDGDTKGTISFLDSAINLRGKDLLFDGTVLAIRKEIGRLSAGERLNERGEYNLRDMKIGLTGGTGSLGAPLIRRALKRERVTVETISREPESPKAREKIPADPKIKLEHGNLFDIKALDGLCKDNDVVYHLGGWARVGPMPEMAKALALNCASTALMVKLAGKWGKRLIYASSGAVYLNGTDTGGILSEEGLKLDPKVEEFVFGIARYINSIGLSVYGDDEQANETKAIELMNEYLKTHEIPKVKDFYGLTKLIGERIVAQYNKGVSLRLWHVYGRGDTSERRIPTLVNEMGRDTDKPLEIDDENINFCYIDTALDALEAAAVYPLEGNKRIINVAGETPVKTRDAAEMIAKSRRVITDSGRKGLPDIAMDLNLLRSTLKVTKQKPFTEGLDEAVDWLLDDNRWRNAEHWNENKDVTQLNEKKQREPVDLENNGVTSLFFAGDLWDDLALWADDAGKRGENVVIALDESVIPDKRGRQGTIHAELIRELKKLPAKFRKRGVKNVIFKSGTGAELAGELKTFVDNEDNKTPYRNIVVIGPDSILDVSTEIQKNPFEELKNEKGDERALLAGLDLEFCKNMLKMDPETIGIDLFYLFDLAVNLAAGGTLEDLKKHEENIKILGDPLGRPRMFMFTPVRPHDLENFRTVLDTQIRVIETKA
ncbi:MAG: SDR family oxidoreductase [Candidatus Omnitrophica bacterium]|nr:SDR family oxidoreductase [Candidatus Omnitrophota bacterium]